MLHFYIYMGNASSRKSVFLFNSMHFAPFRDWGAIENWRCAEKETAVKCNIITRPFTGRTRSQQPAAEVGNNISPPAKHTSKQFL